MLRNVSVRRDTTQLAGNRKPPQKYFLWWLGIFLSSFCLLAGLTLLTGTRMDEKGENRCLESEIGSAISHQGGTEINIRVRPGGETSIFLRKGEVCLTNPQGEVCLHAGEAGYAVPGKAPVKQGQAQANSLWQTNLK